MHSQRSLYEKLTAIANNLWWTWQPEVGELFHQLDPQIWEEVRHNPKLLLSRLTEQQIEERAQADVLHSSINKAYMSFQDYLTTSQTWGDQQAQLLGYRPVAYFSAEFGMHESLRIYSGGLGVLAGDHLKSASDLDIPLVAVGLFYHQGYFSQSIDQTGWQKETYQVVDPETVPMTLCVDPQTQERLLISVQTRTGEIHAQVFELNVGRIRLFLLDSDIPENDEADRQLTARLYGGDHRTRIRQELILGVGGVRALSALGIKPRVIHMNEGHSAFAGLEVINQRMHNDGMHFDDALREVAPAGVFTTHTPVAAGHDRFDSALMEEHLGPLTDSLQIGHEGLMALGRVDPQNHHETFCMTVLAFKTSRRANGVSNLHGVVSRRMWQSLWPWRNEEDIPIGHITNGVHVSTWLAPTMRVLYDKVLPANWIMHTGESHMWDGFENLTSGELWEAHQHLKNQMLMFCRSRMVMQAKRNQSPAAEIKRLEQVLDPRALTIGFARRFAPYKRADLFMCDEERLHAIVNHPEKPVQLIFCGKAHPADEMGKSILQKVVKLSESAEFKDRILFLEDYDMNITRQLVQGVDVWLNNPRRPYEASGTSGQKVVLNGGLNFSVLDGWWAEAYDGKNGFAIGDGECHTNQEIQDARAAESFYSVLENSIVPMFYATDEDGLPQEWIARMKRSVRTLGWRFSADRMVMDYVKHCYIPAAGGVTSEMKATT